VSFKSSRSKVNGLPYVLYEFEVNGKKYKGSVITPGDMTLAGNASAEKVVARYPAGADVQVYYNPNDPNKHFLEKNTSADSGEWGAVIGGNAFITIGVLVYIVVKLFLKF